VLFSLRSELLIQVRLDCVEIEKSISWLMLLLSDSPSPAAGAEAVSYTHLTLPTIYSV
jgi:hypothetical protein